uniref:Uncharacterized protein n=1 Tax=Ditylum brightwellii TaxID=49249 RepID=A0A7S4WC36_9STRA
MLGPDSRVVSPCVQGPILVVLNTVIMFDYVRINAWTRFQSCVSMCTRTNTCCFKYSYHVRLISFLLFPFLICFSPRAIWPQSPQAADPDIQTLIDENIVYKDRQVINLIEKNPSAARAKYRVFKCAYKYPLSIYIQSFRRSSVRVIEALCKAFPEGVREGSCGSKTLLHSACIYGMSSQVVSLLLNEWPEAATVQDEGGRIPLHYACESNLSKYAISLLLKACPLSIKTKDNSGKLPLHYACNKRGPTNIMPLLLESYPEATVAETTKKLSPLDMVRQYFTMIDQHKYLTSTNDDQDKPRTMVLYVGYLVENKGEQEDEEYIAVVRKIMKISIQMKWWGGVMVLFDLAPPSSLVRCFDDIPLSALPSVLSTIGGHCHMLTMWALMKNKQEILRIC